MENKYKTKICIYEKYSKCKKGSNCTYAHNENEIINKNIKDLKINSKIANNIRVLNKETNEYIDTPIEFIEEIYDGKNKIKRYSLSNSPISIEIKENV